MVEKSQQVSMEVAITIAGYVAKKFKKRFGCQTCD